MEGERSRFAWYHDLDEIQDQMKICIVALSANEVFHEAAESLVELMKERYGLRVNLIICFRPEQEIADHLAEKVNAETVLLVADRYNPAWKIRARLFQVQKPPLAVFISSDPPLQRRGYAYDLRCFYDQRQIRGDLPLPRTGDEETMIILSLVKAKQILLEMMQMQPFFDALVEDYKTYLLPSSPQS